MSALAYMALVGWSLAIVSLALLIVAVACIDDIKADLRRTRAQAALRILELEQDYFL